MSEQIGELTVATIFLVAGFAILLNIKALAEFDQRSGAKVHGWFKKRLGSNSSLNVELYSVSTPSGLRKSKLGLGIAGTACLFCGVVSLSFWLIQYFR